MVNIMKQSECTILISTFEKENYTFGQAMRSIREKHGLTIRQIAREVEKTATYISDIERGNNKPPEKKLMQQLLTALGVNETALCNYLYDLAAIERGGVSEDIADYIMKHGDLRLLIRMTKQQKDGELFWAECIKKMK